MALLDLKTDLKSLKYGQDRPDGGSSNQPYIKTDINDIDRGFNQLRLNKFDEGLIRGGVIGSTNAAVTDTLRIGKFLTDVPKGPLFIVKQVGLQLSNPRLESKQVKADRATTGGGFLTNAANFVANIAGKIENAVGPTRIYNLGVNTLAQIPINHIGGHVVRHGFLPTQDPSKYYEAVVTANNQNGTNRLEGLATKFQLGDRQTSTVNQNTPKAINSILGLISKVTGAKIPPIKPAQLTVANYIGGPGSVYGIGNTIINRTSFTEDKFKYDTAIANSKNFAGRTRDKNGNLSEVQVNPLFIPITSNYTSSSLAGSSKNFNLKTNNLSLQNRISADYQSLIDDEFNSIAFAGKTRNDKSQTQEVKIRNTYDFGLSRKTQSDLASEGWGNIQNFPELSGSFIDNYANVNDTGSRTQVGENITDIANYNAPSSYPSNSGTGSIQQDDVYANKLSLPNLVKGYNKNYKDVNTLVKDLTLPNNIGIYQRLVSGQLNGERLPNSPNLPTYRNKLGDDVVVSLPWVNATRERRVGSGRYDQINLTPIFPAGIGTYGDEVIINGAKHNINDLVKFRIQAIDSSNPTKADWMIFRAYITDLSDTVDATWTDVKYAGRGEKFYIYDGFTRKMSVSFKAAALSSKEMKPMYQKLNYLMSNLMPDYTNDDGTLGVLMKGPLMRMTIGNYIDGQLCVLNSLTYKITQDSPWELSLGNTNGDLLELNLPHIIEVTLGFTPIGSQTRDENRLSRKTDGTSHIAQNWNALDEINTVKEYIWKEEPKPTAPPPPVVPPIPTPPPPNPDPVPKPPDPPLKDDYRRPNVLRDNTVNRFGTGQGPNTFGGL